MAIVSDIIQEELEKLRLRIIANMQNAGQVASGRTIRSMHTEVNGNEGTLYGRPFFSTLENGRRAGAVPADFEDIIYEWMINKGINATPIPYKTNKPHKYSPQERANRGMAYCIARKIRLHGSALYRAGGRKDIYSNEIQETINNIHERAVLSIMAEIERLDKLWGNYNS